MDVEARLRALEASPAFLALSQFVPPRATRRSLLLPAAMFLVPWILIGGSIALVAAILSPKLSPRPDLFLWPILVLGAGVIGVVRGVRNPPGWRLAPLRRCAALVVEKRAELEEGASARTWHSVRLSTGGGETREFATDSELFAALNPGDAGMAFTRGDKLHEFLPIES